MTSNTATHHHSGDVLQLDWAAGGHFGVGGAWEAGNVVQQVAPAVVPRWGRSRKKG